METQDSKRLGDHVYDAIMAIISKQKMQIGAKLPPEKEMAQQFGVSRPIIRETLSRLRDEGMIVSRRGAGSFIQRVGATESDLDKIQELQPIDSFEKIRKCYEFRIILEGEGSYLAAINRTEDNLAEIEEWCTALDRAVEARALGGDADFRFHFAIAKASGNGWFATVLNSMKPQIERTIEIARSLSLGKPGTHMVAVQTEHRIVYEAIKKMDEEAAREAMRAHLLRTCNRIFKGSPE